MQHGLISQLHEKVIKPIIAPGKDLAVPGTLFAGVWVGGESEDES